MRRVLSLGLATLSLAGCSIFQPQATRSVRDQPTIVRLERVRTPPDPRATASNSFSVYRLTSLQLPPGFMRFAVVKDRYSNEVPLSDRQFRLEINRIERTISNKPRMVIID